MTITAGRFMFEYALGHVFCRVPGIGQALLATAYDHPAERRFTFDRWSVVRRECSPA